MAATEPTSRHTIRRGLDLPLAGAPRQTIEEAPRSAQVALLGADSVGLKPSFLVQPGSRVRRGETLYEDKKTPGVRYTAPAAGTVLAIHRGDKRAFQSLVIQVEGDEAADAQVAFQAYTGAPADTLSAEAVRALLLESGLWTALRTRPYSHVPAPDASPHALFITAIDTRPHAPQPDIVLADRLDDFQTGVACLAKLTAGLCFVCVAPGSAIRAPAIPHVRTEVFAGPHPAGLAGTHIHQLSPVDLGRAAWHIGYQDVAAIGRLFRTGQLDTHRVVSLAGPCVQRPRLLRTRLGASLATLTQGELTPGVLRVISGSVLDGRSAAGDVHGYLGRYHQQVSVLAEAQQREFLGWIAPGAGKFSIWRVVLGALAPGQGLALTTSTNGGTRAMVPIGSFERVMPLDLMPTFLLRALLMKNDERAEQLGCLELDEEDLALCTFVCPGKAEYGPLLREALTRIEKEAA